MENGKISICKRLDSSFGRMERRKRLRVSEVNPHLICVLCGGYYIDATTIIECLHTFCKTCIVGYLEASKHCPVCDNLVHKTKPHLRLRPDHTLQDIVYKLVPGLFQDEMKKRREFYKDEIETGRVGEHGIPEERERIVYSAEEQISLVLELSPDGNPPLTIGSRSSKQPRLEAADRRYLMCPGSVTVGHLKKFIKMKFNLCGRFQVDFYHTDETLSDHFSLVDIAYIYSWRRKGPMRLYYSVFTNPAKRFKAAPEEEMKAETDTANNSDLKTETSGYFSDDDKHHSETSLTNETDESKTDSVLEGDGIDIDQEEEITSELRKQDERIIDSNKPDDDKCDIQRKRDVSPKVDKSEKYKETTREEKTENVEIKKTEIDTENVLSSTQKGDPEKSVSSPKLLKENESSNVVTDTIKKSVDEKCTKLESCNDKVRSSESDQKQTEIEKSVEKDAESRKTELNHEKPDMVEASTDTVPCTSEDALTRQVPVLKQTKACLTDDDISEPVVSSTQNTQGCQTEPPESTSDTLDIPHSSDSDSISANSNSPCHRSTVDVSCETDNLVVDRQNAKHTKESVSVMTDIEHDSYVNKRNSVHCSTDVYDFPGSDVETEKKSKADCSTDLADFPADSNKRKTLSVDCSINISDMQMPSIKRKSIESDHYNTETKIKKSDTKIPKRSFSYSGQLTSQKAYLAQPLSPTKLTLKFAQPKSPVKTCPKSPVKTCPKSPSRSETSGFQSQYQSFVMELPEKTYRFEDDEPIPPKGTIPVTGIKTSVPITSLPHMQSLPSTQKKALSKSGRPRGRPPKNRSLDVLNVPVKEKKHKSSSHSPKRRKSSEKDRDRSSDSQKSDKHYKSPKASNQEDTHKPSNAYSWINKIDTSLKSTPSADQKSQKSKQEGTEGEKPPSDLRIPKQFLYFSNGQYTLATVSSLNALKQSSPVSPPPRTVFASEVSRREKSDFVSKMNESEYKIPKLSKIAKTESKHTEEKHIEKLDKVSDLKTVKSENANKLNKDKPKDVEKPKSQPLPQTLPKTQTNPKIDANQNKIIKPSVSVGVSQRSKPNNIPSSTASMTYANSTKGKPAVSQPKEKTSATTTLIPEYRHQSPFFASISGAKLAPPQRSATHLNIPNISSHFSGAHPLYSQGRYANERLGTPIYRSFSMNDKSPTSAASKYEETRRMEAMTSPYLSPFPGPYLGLMHSHLISSLPHHHLAQTGHYPDSSKTLTYSDHATNGASSMSQNAQRTVTTKPNNSNGKGKEKSIDKIITAITEMRTKKETQEQLNGIDLSTKASKKTEMEEKSLGDVSKGDKYEFKDEEVATVKPIHSAPKDSDAKNCEGK